MSKIRETVVSNPEKKFVSKLLHENIRLDGRSLDDFRKLTIEFGKDWGSCLVTLGETKVLAQVSCEVQVPKSTRPSEGILYVNLELNPMAAPNFEPGRQTDLSVQLNRLLEKCIKDSKAVDLESLCIKMNEKVWCLRVDVNVLNHEGNILDCASVAALTALAHFRRPDVTCDGEEIIIHTYAQRDSIPTTIHHYPICITFAIFANGDVILADPSLLEEGVAEAFLTLGLNAYNELCGFHLGGSAQMTPESILRTTNKASQRARLVIQQIKDAIESDKTSRDSNKNVGFERCEYLERVSRTDLITSCLEGWSQPVKLKTAKVDTPNTMNDKAAEIKEISKETVVLMPPDNSSNAWKSSSDSDSGDEVTEVPLSKPVPIVVDSDGSEEEHVVVLNADKKTNKKKRRL